MYKFDGRYPDRTSGRSFSIYAQQYSIKYPKSQGICGLSTLKNKGNIVNFSKKFKAVLKGFVIAALLITTIVLGMDFYAGWQKELVAKTTLSCELVNRNLVNDSPAQTVTILFVGQRNSPLPYMVYAPVNTVKQLDEIEAGAFRNHWMVGERSKYIEIDGAYFYRTSNFLSTTELEGGFSWRRLGTLIQGDPWPVSNLVDRTTLKSIEFVTKPWLDATKKDPFLRGKDGATAEIIRQCDIVSLKTVTLQVKQLQSKLLDGRKL